MKGFLKTMLVVMGVVCVLFVSLTLLLIAGNVEVEAISKVLGYLASHNGIKIITIVALGLLGVCSIVSIAFSSSVTSDIKGGVMLPLKVGEVHISSQTFESIVANVAKKYAGLKTGKVNIKIKETGINVDLFAYVLQDTVISDITTKIQEDIKETVLKQTTVKVESVNIKIKGVYTLSENNDTRDTRNTRNTKEA